jgi:adenosylhomocysteine nucleosidase
MARAAIIVALQEEFAPYRALIPGLVRDDDGIWERYVTPDGSLAITLCDCGPINAIAAAERIITTCNPDVLLNTDSAGAHNPELLPGDVIIGNRYTLLEDPLYSARSLRFCWRADSLRVERDGLPGNADLVSRGLTAATAVCAGAQPWAGMAVWPADAAPRRPNACAGVIGSSGAFNRDLDRLDRFWASVQSECEDMESAYIAQVCALHSLPFLAIRCISNTERHANTSVINAPDVLQALQRAGELTARTACAILEVP